MMMMNLSIDDDLEKKDDSMELSMMNTNYYQFLAKITLYRKKKILIIDFYTEGY